jgi:hypothetical protein
MFVVGGNGAGELSFRQREARAVIIPRATQITNGIKAVAPGVATEPIDRYGRGRTCGAQGCDTILSIYNPGSSCGQHEERRRFTNRAARRSAYRGDREARPLVLAPVPTETVPIELAG